MANYSVRILFILLSSLQLIGQESNEYIGAIKLNDSAIITYKVKFDINYDQVEGYSVTDFGGDHETKSKITGTYNSATRELSFNEYDIIYTKSDVIHDDFCFVHFKPTYFKPGKTKYFKGDFKGEFSDGEECISGELFLNSAENVEKRMEKMTKKINRSNRVPDSIKQKTNELKILEKLNMNILKTSQVTSVFSSDQKVSLHIYDGGQEDGDMISIKVNGNIILRRHTISKEIKVLTIPLTSKKTVIEIIADGVGSVTTNTAVLEIQDSKNKIKAMTNLEKNQSTLIHILKRH
ncbi:hypothetical protein [Psychroserpens damuponensis]|uniref:hypothetical protein n=1 Tax=Psychroserpens damuponensis TaxID=943936 RepID=UPI000693ED47|nr:hypothetical protein [Psychroserpens damuponensis]